jgi:hypothetical protein
MKLRGNKNMNQLRTLYWMCYAYGLMMSFTLLKFENVGWWMLTGYIPLCFVTFLWFVTILNGEKNERHRNA